MDEPESGTAPVRPRPKGKPATSRKGARPSQPKGNGAARAKKKKRKRYSPFMRLVRGLMLILSIASVVALIATAYAGNVSPLKYGGLWGILPLCFPGCLCCYAALMALQVFWHWRGFVIMSAGMLACAGPALDVCPLNVGFGERKAPEGAETFTLLSYNIHNFWETRDSADSRIPNRGLQYVLDSGADIVCLQEADAISVSRSLNITAEQVQRLHALYPYVIISGSAQAVLSKFPIEPIHLVVSRSEFDDADLAAYRVTLPGGKIVSLFNVHLQSLALNENDRQLYRKLTDLEKQDLTSVRVQLVEKLRHANIERARQAQALLRFIRHYGGPDVLICGDFNDVATCYTLRTLAGAGFKEVYPEVGFGPIITYNSGRFYFGIDHVLYRGDFKPLSLTKGTLRASDHYPLTVRFATGGGR